jgi:hypothetical protein
MPTPPEPGPGPGPGPGPEPRPGPEAQQCRICLEEEPAGTMELVSPCSCEGSQKHVHLACLRRWQATVEADDQRAWRCEGARPHPPPRPPPRPPARPPPRSPQCCLMS